MRDILFKAKRLDNGEWVEGLLIVMWGQYHIINPNDENTAYPIDTDTLCQYTGLTDKNGNKIWENDVVKWCGKLYKVSFYDSICSYVLVTMNGHWRHMEMNYGDRLECFDYEVIGNIFDNPELMEGE